MYFSQKINRSLENLHLLVKALLLVSGASIFFVVFPFLLKYGLSMYIIFFFFLLVFGVMFRITSDRRSFKIIMWLWASGSLIYLIIASVLIMKNIQPLPYIQMGRIEMILYYISYPLRVLGIFFTGLLFARITSPVEFLRWGENGLKIALAYRAFEYSINAFDTNRKALVIQGQWPDFTERGKAVTTVYKVIKNAP
ncbi:MAG: hypothetical protein ACOC7U_03715, partial [Spirochaetota bacterium]